MSVDIAYVRRSVDAAFRLALRDERAWAGFDLTVDGFFRSFAAMFVVFPIQAVTTYADAMITAAIQASRGKAVDAAAGLGLDDLTYHVLGFVASWLAFPIVMIFVLRFLALAHRYSALIIAHNWGSVVIALFYLPAVFLFLIGLVSAEAAVALNLVVLGLSLYYRFYIAQTALDTGWGTAMAVALLDFLLQIYLLVGLDMLAGAYLQQPT